MTTFLTDDTIDFSAYMRDTETRQRVVSARDFAEDVVRYFHDPKRDRGVPTPWKKLGDKLKFRPHEVTLWSGINGHGKSLGIGQVLLGFLQHGQGSCIASLEMKPEITLARMVRQFFAEEKPDAESIREFHREVGSHLYVYDQVGTVSAEKMFAVIRYCAEELKLKHFVLDSLMKISGIGEDDYTAQKQFVDRLCAEAKDTGIHIHLVAHSKKQRDERTPPGKMDVKGSGTITDQVDNVITWWRNKAKEQSDAPVASEPDALLICDKQRNGEWEGKAVFWFDPKSQRFEEERHVF
jgi:twinkle protein